MIVGENGIVVETAEKKQNQFGAGLDDLLNVMGNVVGGETPLDSMIMVDTHDSVDTVVRDIGTLNIKGLATAYIFGISDSPIMGMFHGNDEYRINLPDEWFKPGCLRIATKPIPTWMDRLSRSGEQYNREPTHSRYKRGIAAAKLLTTSFGGIHLLEANGEMTPYFDFKGEPITYRSFEDIIRNLAKINDDAAFVINCATVESRLGCISFNKSPSVLKFRTEGPIKIEMEAHNPRKYDQEGELKRAFDPGDKMVDISSLKISAPPKELGKMHQFFEGLTSSPTYKAH